MYTTLLDVIDRDFSVSISFRTNDFDVDVTDIVGIPSKQTKSTINVVAEILINVTVPWIRFSFWLVNFH